jgi:hypothetical protein
VIPGLSSIKKYFVILSVIEEVDKIEQRRIQLLLGHRTINSFCRAFELGWAGINSVLVDGLQKFKID